MTFSIAAVCSISDTVSKYLVVASAREDSRPTELLLWLGIAFFDNFLRDLAHLGKNILIFYVSEKELSVLPNVMLA